MNTIATASHFPAAGRDVPIDSESFLPESTVRRIRFSGNPVAFPDAYFGSLVGPKFADAKGMLSNAYLKDAIVPDADWFKAGVGGQGLYFSTPRDMLAAWFTTDDGTEWNEALGRAIALSFD